MGSLLSLPPFQSSPRRYFDERGRLEAKNERRGHRRQQSETFLIEPGSLVSPCTSRDLLPHWPSM
jgi:hypothetical protein